MSRYYIEIPHEAEEISCLKAIKVLLETGSHFLTNADFGCQEGDHNARMIIEAESKEEAEMIIPRAYRAKAKIITLNKFSIDEVEALMKHHL